MQDLVVAVFGSSGTKPDDPHWTDGLRCGQLLAEAGLAVATGGYGGLMEAVSAGAAAAGGRVIGVTAPAVFPDRAAVNEFVTEVIEAKTLPERVDRLLGVSDASITMHGSIGTLTELMAAWNSAFVARFSSAKPKPLVVVGPRWTRIVTDLAASLETDLSLVYSAPSVDEAVATILATLTN